MTALKKKWLTFGGIGLALVGAGFSVAVDAAFIRLANPSGWGWIIQGTIGLCIFNAGLSFFGEAIALRGQLLQRESERK